MRMWMTYSDDGRRHYLQGAGAGHSRSRHRRPPCRSRASAASTAAGRSDNSFYIYLGGLIGGGWGAKHDSDGVNATVAINDGDTHNGPSEQVEAKYPLLVERYALRPDSGGAGEFRGGLGTEQVVQTRRKIRFNAQMDRVKCRPWGLYGGARRLRQFVAIHRFGEDEQGFANGKAFNQVLEPGDAYILRSGGGGGFGSPLDREPEKVERDVRQGYVTKAAAEKLYGLVFHDGTLDVDLVRTQKRREEMRGQGLPVNDPETPDAPGEGWSLNLNRRRPPETWQAQRRRAAGHRHDRAVLLAPPPGAAGFAISGS